MRFLPLLLLAAACASPGREFQRGTVTSRPPGARPGVGAPAVGQPGEQPQTYPRSPHQRILPPTRGPGLWSGDTPRASRSVATWPPELFGVTLPFADAAHTEEDEAPTRYCAFLMGSTFSSLYEPKQLAMLTSDQQRCLAAQLYFECSTRLLRILEDARDSGGTYLPREHRIHVAVTEAAKRFRRGACNGVVPHIHARSMLQATIREWENGMWRNHVR